MPQIDDITTASHRPFLGLHAYRLTLAIAHVGSVIGNDESDWPPPNEATMRTATHLIAEVPFRLLGDPDVSSFYGEIHLSWSKGPKQIVVMCFPDRAPLLHHYLRVPGAPSVHGIEDASGDRLAHWLRWLRA